MYRILPECAVLKDLNCIETICVCVCVCERPDLLVSNVVHKTHTCIKVF